MKFVYVHFLWPIFHLNSLPLFLFNLVSVSQTSAISCQTFSNKNNVSKLQNIGTQSVQELFFAIGTFKELFYSNDLVFGCDVQQERNWEFMIYIRCYIGNVKIAK